jgi:signal transduction histidine kinase
LTEQEFAKTARPRENWAATARQAMLFALPLAFAALLGVQWLDADFIMMRESAQKHSAEIADDLGGVLAQSVTTFATQAWGEVQQAESDVRSPSSALWQVIYGYNLNLLVLQRKGERTLFPPEDPLAMPKMWEERVHALSDVADLLRDGDRLSGWFPNVSGEFYFECHRAGAGAAREENCIAASSRQIFPLMFAALDERAKNLPEWSFRLRDPFDRIVWRRGESSESYQSFVLSGSMHNWTLELSGAPAPRRSLLGRLALATPLALVWLLLVFQARRAQNALLAESSARAALATRLSHDLRTPLANLKLYAELISRKAAEVPGVSRYCTVLTEEIDRLDLLAGETIFRGDALKRDDATAESAVDACALARRILARYEKLLAASKSTCELACGVDKVLRFNVTAFERILINLIDNARKYAPGRILVSIDFRDDFLSLAVRDFGAAAAGAEGAAAAVSHGMGLAIVKELTRANSGGFSLSGADPGLCATATIKADLAGDKT